MGRRKPKLRQVSETNVLSKIEQVFRSNPKKRYNARQVKKLLKLKNNVDSVSHYLNVLFQDEVIFKLNNGKYRLDRKSLKSAPPNLPSYSGKVDLIKTGAAFVVVDELEKDVYVPLKHINGAFDGDIVTVKLTKKAGSRRPEGKILSIQKRSFEKTLGIFQKVKNGGSVVVNTPKKSYEIKIHPNDINGAVTGDKVKVKLTEIGKSQNSGLWGSIAEVLTNVSDHEWAMHQIILENGFDLEFEEDVIRESELFDHNIDPKEIEKRRDFRQDFTITIDPLTAKDFDDAISLVYLDNGNVEVGVHIADVTHFVKPGTAIDKEAIKRTTSVYLVDRAVPMLPEVLSNNLCSLRPNVDRLCFSAVFEFTPKHKLVKSWFGKGIIHSDRRFTYEEAQEVIEEKSTEFSKEILLLNNIATHLRKEKFKNGAISFESDEIVFKLDENNTPVDVYKKERKEAHLLVEDFMLLANKKVAEYIHEKSKDQQEIPFVYRVHDEPNMEKLADFKLLAEELGFDMKIDTPQQIADSFKRMSKVAKENEVIKLIEPMAIRTMSKAIYTTENIGHYGLSFDHYTHFTSPIRRYSDVIVHRVLEKNLKETYRENKANIETICQHISNRERKAMDAERASIKYKQVEYLINKIGETFSGIISGITEYGIFVELEGCKAEGMIRYDKFNDSFEVKYGNLKAIGKNSKREFQMGMKVKAKLLDTDLNLRQIELELID